MRVGSIEGHEIVLYLEPRDRVKLILPSDQKLFLLIHGSRKLIICCDGLVNVDSRFKMPASQAMEKYGINLELLDQSRTQSFDWKRRIEKTKLSVLSVFAPASAASTGKRCTDLLFDREQMLSIAGCTRIIEAVIN